MARTLTTCTGQWRIVKDSSLRGKSYGVKTEAGNEIHVSPSVFNLLFTSDGKRTPDFENVAHSLMIKIVKELASRRHKNYLRYS